MPLEHSGGLLFNKIQVKGPIGHEILLGEISEKVLSCTEMISHEEARVVHKKFLP
jgi:hypothetical protein